MKKLFLAVALSLSLTAMAGQEPQPTDGHTPAWTYIADMHKTEGHIYLDVNDIYSPEGGPANIMVGNFKLIFDEPVKVGNDAPYKYLMSTIIFNCDDKTLAYFLDTWYTADWDKVHEEQMSGPAIFVQVEGPAFNKSLQRVCKEAKVVPKPEAPAPAPHHGPKPLPKPGDLISS